MSREPGSRHEGRERDEALDPALAELLRLDDRPGPAVRISSKRAASMVDGALDAWAASSSSSPSSVVPETRVEGDRAAPSSRGRWRLGMLAVAATFVVLGAAAAYWVARDRGWLGGPEPAPSEPSMRLRSHAPAAAEPAVAPAVGAREEEPAAAPVEARPVGPTAPAPAARAVERPAPRAPEASPDDLLRDANRLRASRRWREAERTYARVMREHPGTMSAHVARVAAAEIRLSHLGDPRGALRLYRAALGGGGRGALALEARQGIAEAHRRMGNSVEETRALRAIVASHPGTPAARRASRRLAEIDSTP